MRTIFLLIRKEFLQVFRDRLLPRMVLVAPIVVLVVLANAMTFEVRHTELALVDQDRSSASARLVQAFTATGRFRVAVDTPSGAVADDALLERRANAILRIPADFERDLRKGARPMLQFILNAEDGASAAVVNSYAAVIVSDFAARWRAETPVLYARDPSGRTLRVETRKLYNPAGRYRDFMSIGLLAALLTLVGVLISALNIAREKEIGTLEQLNATPITRSQFILGKLIPFWLLGMIELAIGLLVIRFVFGVAFVGNPAVVFLGAGIYLVAALGIGLLISTGASNQQQALFITYFIIVTFFFMGGIFTPVESMPRWARLVAEANPIKHFVVVLRSVLLKGAGVGQLWREMLAMLLIASVVLPVALARYRKTSA